jgi:ribosomal-protein-alanine N-acetyltransferase
MIIRAWEEKDIPAIADIENKSFADPWTEGMLSDTLRFPVYHTFLAEEGGQVCGYGCLILLFEDAELANIAVSPTHRGQGIGKLLMEKMHDYAKTFGAERMLLEVRVSNQNAIGLYEKYGYEKYGLRENYYADGEDAYLMPKSLL